MDSLTDQVIKNMELMLKNDPVGTKLLNQYQENKSVNDYLAKERQNPSNKNSKDMALAYGESNKQLANIQKRLMHYTNTIKEQQEEIGKRENLIKDKITRSGMQKKEIEYKQTLINTRNRMLQLSQEKNVYKLKVIYTLVAIIIFVIICMLVGYVYFIRK